MSSKCISVAVFDYICWQTLQLLLGLRVVINASDVDMCVGRGEEYLILYQCTLVYLRGCWYQTTHLWWIQSSQFGGSFCLCWPCIGPLWEVFSPKKQTLFCFVFLFFLVWGEMTWLCFIAPLWFRFLLSHDSKKENKLGY